jgi:hypothetical protein
MPYLGHKPLSETAPNHPLAHSQISFGVKRPGSLKKPSRNENVSAKSQSRSDTNAQDVGEDGTKENHHDQ